MNVVEDALNLYLKGKPWHFALSNTKYYTSNTVDSIFKEVKDMPNLLSGVTLWLIVKCHSFLSSLCLL